MKKLSERWMYYSGLLSATLSAKVDDLKHIQNLIDAEEQGMLLRLREPLTDDLRKELDKYVK